MEDVWWGSYKTIQSLGIHLPRSEGSLGRLILRAQPVDATPSKQLIRQYLPPREPIRPAVFNQT